MRSDGTLPAPLAADTDYYVINFDRDAQTLQLSASSAGAAINITSAGSGIHTIALELQSLTVTGSYTGSVGLPQRTETEYWEYRPIDLVLGILSPSGGINKTITIGEDEGDGAGRINLDLAGYAVDVEILNTGSPIDTGGRDCGGCRCVPKTWKLTPLGGGVLFPSFSPEQAPDPESVLLRRTSYRYGDTCSWSIRHPDSSLNEHWFLGRHGLGGRWSVQYWDIADFGFEFGFVIDVLAQYELLLSDGLKYGIPIDELNRISHFRCTGRNIFGPAFAHLVGTGFPDFVMVEPYYA